jgi:hypothetical protein
MAFVFRSKKSDGPTDILTELPGQAKEKKDYELEKKKN